MSDNQHMAAAAGDIGIALAAIEELLHQQRWSQAAMLLKPIAHLDGSLPLKLNICRNLDVLERHRPEVYQAVQQVTGPERYTIGTSASGHPTIFYTRHDGSRISLSPGNQPVASLSATFARIKESYQAGKSMALLGIGDGYLLKSCSLHPPVMLFEAQQPVYLFEPDPHAILACLMLHDYTGPNGPIEAERFSWFVGPEYAQVARRCLKDDSFNAIPECQVAQSPHAAEIAAELQSLLREILSEHQALIERLRTFYATIPQRQWEAVWDGTLNQKPRVLLITTRLSSVLQYSTRDAAAGFEANGWEARLFIEPKPHQSVTLVQLAKSIWDFKPHLIFQIDHLRTEWHGVIPSDLPFACWIQDHLNNLTRASAGRSITPRDFVLVGMPAMYVERYGYPARQCVELTKLTHVPDRPASWTNDGDDMVYVSSASQTPLELTAELLRRFDQSAQVQELVAAACEDQIERYSRGESLPTLQATAAAFQTVEDRLGMALDHAELRRAVLDALFDRMSNLLYRQQGLRWAAAVAAKQGIQLAICGPGWEKHPEFARFARGPVKYGSELEQLTRRSKINLLLEPFLSGSHQRLLDGLVAGGFFLVRDHPSNTLYPELLDYLATFAPIPETTEQLHQAAAKRDESKICSEILARCECLAGHGDIVNVVRGGERAGVIQIGKSVLPGLSLVSFASQSELDQATLAFLSDEPSRRRMAQRQRVSVEERLSYAVGMKRVIDRIGMLIQSERLSAAA